jgi:hypothetical protein
MEYQDQGSTDRVFALRRFRTFTNNISEYSPYIVAIVTPFRYFVLAFPSEVQWQGDNIGGTIPD